MTGREQKVYYSYSQISHKHSVPDDGLPPQAQPPPQPPPTPPPPPPPLGPAAAEEPLHRP